MACRGQCHWVVITNAKLWRRAKSPIVPIHGAGAIKWGISGMDGGMREAYQDILKAGKW
jgi:hypothetical protein